MVLSDSSSKTLVALLKEYACSQKERLACTFLEFGAKRETRLTYGELDNKVRACAAGLQERCEPGDRVLLLYPQSPDFLIGFLACLYAGLIAVPLYPPKKNRNLARMLAVLQDADARLAIATSITAQVVRDANRKFELKLPCELLVHSELKAQPDAYVPFSPVGDDLAFLQYTSGSTGNPKGVMVSHGNLIANWEFTVEAHRFSAEDIMVSWLPTFHDLGLILGLLQPLFRGATCYQMSPASFVQRPVRWLEAISKHRGTHSASPNFGFELCLEKVTDEEIDDLDLSSWRFALNGAEPVRYDTIRGFNQRFARCGWRPEAMSPAYGLAEGTLVSTTAQPGAKPNTRKADPGALERHQLLLTGQQERGRVYVSCGRGDPKGDVAIVDIETGLRCPPDRIGEVWLRGPSNAKGYWRRPEVTDETFGAQIRDPLSGKMDGPFLRTGDLGFMAGGELYLTGRIKDVIILRGMNYYPQDIELTVERFDSAFRPGCSAAFTVPKDNHDYLVVVQEVNARDTARLRTAGTSLFEGLRAEVAGEHDLDLAALLLIPAYHIPKTSSGKIQRRQCRKEFLNNGFPKIIAAWNQLGDPARSVQPKGSTRDVLALLKIIAAAALRVKPETLLPDAPLERYGMDSVTAVSISGAIASRFKVTLPTTLLYDYPTLESLAEFMAGITGAPSLGRSKQAGGARKANNSHSLRGQPIAVIGVGCRFPGSDNPSELWQLIRNGADAVGMPSDSRAAFLPPEARAREGGYLKQIDRFDAGFFGISPREAVQMDPQQRLLLEVAVETFSDAGLPTKTLAGSSTGVFIGISAHEYERLLLAAGVEVDRFSATGNALSIAANRICYTFDLRGPGLAIDTACSSSLVAVHHAVASLRRGECDRALAGGVNILLDPRVTEGLQHAQMLASHGRCKSFDASADGYVRSEGCGLVLLRRLDDAWAAGDHIHGVILGSAVNQDGRSNGLTAPSGPAQEVLLRRALSDANLAPEAIGYVEAHGSATTLGDPIEWHALASALGDNEPRYIGSVKGNIGHTEAAAGIAGLLRALFSVKYGAIAPQCHFEKLNPHISRPESLQVAGSLIPWPGPGSKQRQSPRTAGVSSFGFGGTNAHVIISEPQEREPSAIHATFLPGLLSARSATALKALARRMAAYLVNPEPAVSWGDICLTLATGRDHFAHRLTVVADDMTSAAELLNYWLRHGRHPRVRTGTTEHGSNQSIAFLFPGHGSLTSNAGKQLFESLRGYKDEMTVCSQVIEGTLGSPLDSYLYAGRHSTAISNGAMMEQVATVALAFTMAHLYMRWGVRPKAVIGYGVGEWAAATYAGCLSIKDCLRLVAIRAQFLQKLPPGAMVAVQSHENAMRGLIEGLPLDVAAFNGPNHLTVSGPMAACSKLTKRLQRARISHRPLGVGLAFHSSAVDRILDGFEEETAKFHYNAPNSTFYSTTTGMPHAAAPNPAYWRRHTRQPILFGKTLEHLGKQGVNTCLQVGPGGGLLAIARDILEGPLLPTLASAKEPDDWFRISTTLTELYVRGYRIDWVNFFEDTGGLKVSGLPAGPFERRSHWFTAKT